MLKDELRVEISADRTSRCFHWTLLAVLMNISLLHVLLKNIYLALYSQPIFENINQNKGDDPSNNSVLW